MGGEVGVVCVRGKIPWLIYVGANERDWKSGYGNGRSFKHVRVLTVTYDQDYMHSLRRAAQPIGRDRDHPSTWKAPMFTHATAFDLPHPELILNQILLYADDDTSVSLI